MNILNKLSLFLFKKHLFLTLSGCGILIYLLSVSLYTPPKQNDWLCWAIPVKEDLERCQSDRAMCAGNGTYAYSKYKDKAIELALEKCYDEYKTYRCSIDYCEKL